MTWVMFSPMVAEDALTRAAIDKGEGVVYAVEDTTLTSPLQIRDASAVGLTVVEVAAGRTITFEANVSDSSATYEVRWKSGENVMIIGSYRGLQKVFFDYRDAAEVKLATLAQQATQAAAAAQAAQAQVDAFIAGGGGGGGTGTGLTPTQAASLALFQASGLVTRRRALVSGARTGAWEARPSAPVVINVGFAPAPTDTGDWDIDGTVDA